MLQFNTTYFYLAIVLFIIETAIAIFLDDRIIRPFVGDVLVVILLYCVIKAFWPLRPRPAALLVFAFAGLIEGLQYVNIVDRLGLRDNRLFAIIIGTTFDGKDILAYALGTALVLIAEHYRPSNRRQA